MAALAVVPPPASLAARVQELELIVSTLEAFEHPDELSPELYDQLQRQLVEAIAGTREKVDRTAAVLADLRAMAESAKAEITRLQERKQRSERAIARLETYVLSVIATSGIEKLDGRTATFSARLNPEAVIVDDESLIPGAFLRVPPTPAAAPDKTAIKAELKRGNAVPGCRLHATERLVVS